MTGTAIYQTIIPNSTLPKARSRLRTVDYNHALQLQKKGATLREISELLDLPYGLVVDDLYWDARS